MRKRRFSNLFLYFTIFLFICQFSTFLPFSHNASAIDDNYLDESENEQDYGIWSDLREELLTNNNSKPLHNETFDATYYLTRNPDGTPSLKINEEIRAHLARDHGIWREINVINNNPSAESNRLTVDPFSFDIKVTRDGSNEPISKVDKSHNSTIYYIGDSEKTLSGDHTYNISYEMVNPIANEKDYQLWWWDVNGTNWGSIDFQKVSVTIAVSNDLKNSIIGEPECYVGKYLQGDPDGCIVTKTDTGFKIESTSTVFAQENLGFTMKFNPDTFVMPKMPVSYELVTIASITFIICAVVVLAAFFFIRKSGINQYSTYKKTFLAPQYQPPKDLNVAISGVLYLGKTKNWRVATLLETIVSHKASLIKNKEEGTWTVKINQWGEMTEEQKSVIKALAGKDEDFPNGTTIKIEKHQEYDEVAWSNVLLDDHDKSAIEKAIKKKLLKKEIHKKSNINLIFLVIIALFVALVIFNIISNSTAAFLYPQYVYVVAKNPMLIAPYIFVICTAIAIIIIVVKYRKFTPYTEEGVKKARYLDGLKLYIKMAEAERIKFLQSTEADTTPEGIVKLYEKLLPYAALFGLEKSWIKEMSKYCEEIDLYTPYTDITYMSLLSRDFGSLNNGSRDPRSLYNAEHSVRGGGGGGFSGGGGGGGGGGTW